MTGVANYTFNIVNSALELDPDLRFTGFRDLDWRGFGLADAREISRSHDKQGEGDRSGSASLAHLKSRILDVAVRLPGSRAAAAAYRSFRRGRFSTSVGKQSLDLFHAFNFRPLADPGVPMFPVIYDLSTFRHPEFHPRDRVKWLEPLRTFVADAPLVHTISDFSKREIADVFGYPLTRIVVAPPAASALFVPAGREKTQPALRGFDLAYGDYFLAVGTHEPRKNLRTAILAYGRLSPTARMHCPLVLAGGRGWGDLDLPAQTENLIREGSLRFVHGIADPQLRGLYEGARLLVSPSLYEGFGMPVVEALACGTPVAHSAGTSMDEISGTIGVRVAALDVDGWSEAFRDALESDVHADPALREARIAQARQFDWRQSAGVVIDAYRRILG
ncbi:glycosyl transferase [Bradyrhizobiaceae bacterium SG-6C]|nr:glycosyl transferase [Bradyrhizobiaceae bacterium SG-6C]